MDFLREIWKFVCWKPANSMSMVLIFSAMVLGIVALTASLTILGGISIGMGIVGIVFAIIGEYGCCENNNDNKDREETIAEPTSPLNKLNESNFKVTPGSENGNRNSKSERELLLGTEEKKSPPSKRGNIVSSGSMFATNPKNSTQTQQPANDSSVMSITPVQK